MALLVQHASTTTTTGTAPAVTLGAAATIGNCLVAGISALSNTATQPSVSAVKLGGAADNFASAVSEPNATELQVSAWWTDQDLQTSSTAVAVTLNTSSAATVDVYELSGIKTSSAVDKTNGAVGNSGTTFSVGSAALSQASEVAFALVGLTAVPTAPTITGPGSPWTSETQLSTTASGGSPFAQLSGYQQVSATTALTYSGSYTSGESVVGWTSVIVTLELASGPSGPAPLLIPPGFQSPMAFRRRTWPTQAPPLVPAADTGSGADAATVTATLSSGDTGSGAESATAQQGASSTDTGTGTESASTSATLSSGDTGSGAEAAKITPPGSGDTGSGAEDSGSVTVRPLLMVRWSAADKLSKSGG
jgi:hypothetical protein